MAPTRPSKPKSANNINRAGSPDGEWVPNRSKITKNRAPTKNHEPTKNRAVVKERAGAMMDTDASKAKTLIALFKRLPVETRNVIYEMVQAVDQKQVLHIRGSRAGAERFKRSTAQDDRRVNKSRWRVPGHFMDKQIWQEFRGIFWKTSPFSLYISLGKINDVEKVAAWIDQTLIKAGFEEERKLLDGTVPTNFKGEIRIEVYQPE